MNKKGFTLVELLAVIILLGIIVGIAVLSVNNSYKGARDKSEAVFIKTIEDAIEVYLSSDGSSLSYSTSSICNINKTHGQAKLYKSTSSVTFNNVMNSTYKPISANDMHNPAIDRNAANYNCSTNGTLYVYRDSDYVYYYKIAKSSFGCFNTTGNITNLPSECANK